MIYLICLILGPALIYIGIKTRGRSEGSGAMFLLSFLWLSVQVAGVLYSILKVKYQVNPGLTPFDLFDYTTWNGPEWLYMVGFGIYGFVLFLFSIYYRWPSYLLILLGVAMLEYDVLSFVVGVILASDYTLLRLLGILVKMVLEIYLGLMAYISIFGVLTFIAPFKDYSAGRSLGEAAALAAVWVLVRALCVCRAASIRRTGRPTILGRTWDTARSTRRRTTRMT